MTEEVLTRRRLNRALLARQLLLERSSLSIPEAVDQVGGLQTQYAPSAYVGLWTRLAGFERDELTRALEKRTVVQATLMRDTIHVVSAREFWLFAMGVRRARREWWLRLNKGAVTDREMTRRAGRLRSALADGPRTFKELGGLLSGQVSLWVDLVRVPPSGTWERRRADLYGLAEDWVGACDVTEEQGLEHVLRSYLRGFGPASLKSVSSWSGVPVTPLKPAARRLELRRYRDEEGRELLDVERRLPDGDKTVPVRLLPHWDATLLVHARRTLILPEEHRPKVFPIKNPFSVGTILVDGSVAGAWSLRDGRIVLDRYERVPRALWREVEAEAARLEAFHA